MRTTCKKCIHIIYISEKMVNNTTFCFWNHIIDNSISNIFANSMYNGKILNELSQCETSNENDVLEEELHLTELPYSIVHSPGLCSPLRGDCFTYPFRYNHYADACQYI